MSPPDYESRVAIIIPVYNGEKYLKVAIESAQSQTWKNKEIIVVDDGSADRTSKIMMESDGIDQVYKINGGTASALNRGIANSQAKWIKWLSADDLLYSDAIQNMMREATSRDVIYYTHYDIIDESGNVTGEFVEHDRPESELWGYYYGNGSSWLLHRDLYEKVGPFDESFKHSEDYEYLLRATQMYGCKLQLINMKSIKYRRHPEQLTKKVGGQLDDFIKNKIRRMINDKPVVG